MTADEIRKEFCSSTPCFDSAEPHSVANAQIWVLGEIAAQLAELNQKFPVPFVPVMAPDEYPF